MEIAGFESLSLVDYPEEICCVVFLKKCNFRCGFCYNPQLVIKEEVQAINKNEILDFLEKRKGKLTGVCITGGEPTLTIEEKFLEEIKSLGYKIKLDTNGSQPEKIKKLIASKLIDYIAMDIKGPRKKYQKIVNAEIPLKAIEQSIRLISKFPNHEFRTTVISSIHSENDIEDMLQWLFATTNEKIKNFSLQGFKNKGNFIDNKFKKEKETTESYLIKLKKIADKFCESVTVKY